MEHIAQQQQHALDRFFIVNKSFILLRFISKAYGIMKHFHAFLAFYASQRHCLVVDIANELIEKLLLKAF